MHTRSGWTTATATAWTTGVYPRGRRRGSATRTWSGPTVGRSWTQDALERPETPAWLGTLPASPTLRHIWAQQSHPRERGGRWRTNDELLPASQVVNSPYDPEARYGQKRGTTWVG
jgi:hypothetical protein